MAKQILERKARDIAVDLLRVGLIAKTDFDDVKSSVLWSLRNSGDMFLEDGHNIQVKTVVRDDTGRAIGAQG